MVTVYYEGNERLKEGFREFFREVGRPRFITAYSRSEAIRDFSKALGQNPKARILLLIDSEGPDTRTAFQETQLPQGLSGSVLWMVQVMEAWFLADVSAVKDYYGRGFHDKAVRGNPNVEEIPKNDVLARLKRATKGTGKGEYNKVEHAVAILRKIDPEKVRNAARNCDRIFKRMRRAAVLDSK
jgi:hypothetical protein